METINRVAVLLMLFLVLLLLPALFGAALGGNWVLFFGYLAAITVLLSGSVLYSALVVGARSDQVLHVEPPTPSHPDDPEGGDKPPIEAVSVHSYEQQGGHYANKGTNKRSN